MKRRRTVHGMSEVQETALWDCVFETGTDFFSSLEPLGLNYWQGVPEPVPIDVQDAWRRLGARFLAARALHPSPHPRVPWALRELGSPR